MRAVASASMDRFSIRTRLGRTRSITLLWSPRDPLSFGANLGWGIGLPRQLVQCIDHFIENHYVLTHGLQGRFNSVAGILRMLGSRTGPFRAFHLRTTRRQCR